MKWHNSVYNGGTSVRPLTGGEFQVKFPREEQQQHLNLIESDYSVSTVKSELKLEYCIVPKLSPAKYGFVSLDPSPGLQPNFRFMLFNGDWYDENGRWWPTGMDCAELRADGETRIYSMKLMPKAWSNVWGKQNGSVFRNFVGKRPAVWLAFGGGNSFSHGVTIRGATATLQVLRFKVKKRG